MERKICAVLLATAVAGVFNGSQFPKPIPDEIFYASMAFALSLPLLAITQLFLEFGETVPLLRRSWATYAIIVGHTGVIVGITFTIMFTSKPLSLVVLGLLAVLLLFMVVFLLREGRKLASLKASLTATTVDKPIAPRDDECP